MNTTLVLQKIIQLQYTREQKKFQKSLNRLEETQAAKLQQILNYLRPSMPSLNEIKTYDDFIAKQKTTHYSDWQPWIEEIRNNEKHSFRKICSRFEPTSGSTNAIKWIPYSKAFLQELNLAAATWLADTFSQYPKALEGKHYWSLSWVPPHLRDSHNSNDVDLFPFWQRAFLSQIMAVPDQVKMAGSQEACWFASLVYLVACRDLSLISIWSPTFLIQMLNDIIKFKSEIVATLKNGFWCRFSNELKGIACPQSLEQSQQLQNWTETLNTDTIKLTWPKLALISAWDSSTARGWAKELKKLFPDIPLQGKGLWATEGVVTFPYHGQKVLATRSHFYEFRCLQTDRILPCWQIEVGMQVQPIITSSSGLLRYELPDKMTVTHFIGDTPCLQFVNRINSIDLVGEKIDFDTAQSLIQEINHKFGVHGICLIADKNAIPKPKYELLIEGTFQNKAEIEEYLETKLCNNYHYKLSRQLGQLGASQVLPTQDALQILKQFHKSSIGGNNKIEPIVLRHEQLLEVNLGPDQQR